MEREDKLFVDDTAGDIPKARERVTRWLYCM